MKRSLGLVAIASLGAMMLLPACSHHRGRHGRYGAEHQQKMTEHHARLDELVHRMNTSTGQEKIDATAAVVNEMLRFRKEKHGKTCQHHKP